MREALHPVFVALDFETADYALDSACAVGLVKAKGDVIIRRESRLIRPPSRTFTFTYLHGIEWDDVADKPTFRQLWPEIAGLLDDADFIAAHNSSFDSRVLYACCRRARLRPPDKRFVCTVKLARRVWGIHPTKLPDVCRHLKIKLAHHKALSDAEACARIVMAALRSGVRP